MQNNSSVIKSKKGIQIIKREGKKKKTKKKTLDQQTDYSMSKCLLQ